MDELLTIGEAAQRVGRTYRTIQRWLALGRLPERGRLHGVPARNGGAILVSLDEVQELAGTLRRGPVATQDEAVVE